MDKRLVLAIWILLGLSFVVIPVLHVVMKSNYLFGVDLLLCVSLGLMTIAWSYKKRYEFWKLNKERRKNPLSWKTRLKRAKKPVIKNRDGKTLSLSGRGEIVFLTILTWIVVEGLCVVGLKLDPVTSFEVACIAGFTVLGSLIALYFSRRKRRMIEKFRPKPRITKVGFVVAPLLMWLVVFFGTGVTGFGSDRWTVGLLLGGVLAGLMWVGAGLRVRKTGWKKFSWADALNTVSKAMYAGARRGAFTRWAGNVSKSRRVSFGNIDSRIERAGYEYREHYNQQLKREREWNKWLEDHDW
ncbi:MAG: hypothetical protein KGI11_08475 [Thaumarchaeota archaeon]|nr:hypothetical protein [Nitrososphaerota archaeon]